MYDMDMSNQGNRPFVASKTPRKTDNGESTILLYFDLRWNHLKCTILGEYLTFLYISTTTISCANIILSVRLI